jgi:hypothetical protein
VKNLKSPIKNKRREVRNRKGDSISISKKPNKKTPVNFHISIALASIFPIANARKRRKKKKSLEIDSPLCI